MKNYDLHIHSYYSKCSVMAPKTILRVAKKKGLNGIAVADHNSFKGSKEVIRLNKDKNFEIVPAMEIKTQYGDVLVYYLQKEIKTRDFFELIGEARKQDALISIAHPFRLMPHLRFKGDLRKVKDKIDAIEAFNGRNFPWENKKASKIADDLRIGKTGSSDGHFVFEIGNGVTMFEGNLREAIKKRKTQVGGTTIVGPWAACLSACIRRLR